jgi:4-methylaminobutanoate oxidase (formaldehyde-forming)
MSQLPSHARVVIAGGGIMGCSTAYHLAQLGWRDVLVLEREKLTSGSTFHAAGLVGQLRSSASITRLLGRSVALYESLEAETGQATGWKKSGGLRLACRPERMEELRRQATTAKSFGLEMHLLDPAEAGALWPPMETSDLVGAAFLPTDGSASPADITQALARGARSLGVRIVTGCPVTAVTLKDGRVVGVETPQGRVACEALVNCAGQWAPELGRLCGVNVPLVSLQHQYLVTEPMEGIPRDLPTLRDPDRLTYYKEETGGLVMGGYEPDPLPWAVDGIPEGFHFQLLDPDFEHFGQLAELAAGRMPDLPSAGIRQLVNGPEAFTPDGYFILGEAPELRGCFVGAGFNAFGIAAGGGAGAALAEWIVGGEPPGDLWPVDIRRFGVCHGDPAWVRSRTAELYGKHYAISWPSEEHRSGRPYRRSPLYERLADAGACFGEKSGWERPNWFAATGVEPRDEPSFGTPNWHDAVAAEHKATRERAALFDQTSFAKLELRGSDAASALEWLCANRVPEPGRLVYTQMLNARGGVECDLTVSRLAEDHFYLVTGTAFATHDADWIARHLEGRDAELRDVTGSFSVLALMGPRAREVLAKIADGDVSTTGFPFGAVHEIDVEGQRLRALRVTYVGELGWELHMPTEAAPAIYDAIVREGKQHGLANAGYRAIESLRLEKGYRAFGAELTPDHTPLEAGLGWAVKLSSDLPFLGREALERQRRAGVSRRLAAFTVETPGVSLFGRETVLRDGEVVGWLTSGGFGHTIGKAVGYGYVSHPTGETRSSLRKGRYELEVASERVPATLHLEALVDPRHLRVRA